MSRFLLFLLFCLWFTGTFASDRFNDPVIKKLIRDSSILYGKLEIDSTPNINFVTETEIHKLVCDGPCRGIIVGIYRYQDKTIYLNEKWDGDNIWEASYFVHEMIHYFQDQDGLMNDQNSCFTRFRLEHQAYQLQNVWLLNNGRMFPPRMLQMLTQISAGCEE